MSAGELAAGQTVGRAALGRFRVHAGLPALLGSDRCRSGRERVVPAAGLGKGDDVANRRGAGQQRIDPVPPEGDAAVRWRAVLERLEQEAELLLGLRLVQPHDGEDPFLNIPAVDTNRTATDLIAVPHYVVRRGQR